MKVLVGGPARSKEGAVYELHRAGLEAQEGDFEFEIHHEIVEDPGGPRWHDMKIRSVGQARQWYCDRVRDGDYDALWMVDTDVICGPKVLETLLLTQAQIVYGVYWTQAQWQAGPPRVYPQVWDRHPYGHSSQLWQDLNNPAQHVHTVLGGGGCTLIRKPYLKDHRAQYHPPLESIRYSGGMWAGEDRMFNLRAEVRGVPQIAITGLPLVHLHAVPDDAEDQIEAAREFCGIKAEEAP